MFWPAKGQVIEDTKLALKKTGNIHEATALFRSLPWVKRNNIKGLSPSLFFSQAAVYFLKPCALFRLDSLCVLQSRHNLHMTSSRLTGASSVPQ